MTHEHIKALDELIDAVESGGDAIQHNIYIKAAHAFPPENAYGKCLFYEVPHAFCGSLEAANALHEALLPGWEWEIRKINYPKKISYVTLRGKKFRELMKSENQNPARAWLIAILKAYREKMEVKPIPNN